MRNILTLTLMLTLSGCSSIVHELQPHRLWRWNYHEPPGRTDDALFSIDDPLVQQDRLRPSAIAGTVDSEHE
jgi:hypothetical protein